MATVSQASFATLLKRHRLAAGLTQEELAERAGLSARAVSDLERGLRTTPRQETVDLLGEALALDPPARAQLHAAVSRRRGPAPAPPTPTLPAEPTPLLGREQDEARAIHLLRWAGVRLLTLTGPGGVGKTRLAMRVALSLAEDFADGVTFVPLAAITDAALVPLSLSASLGLREQGGQPIEELLVSHLHTQQRLLVLDNVEHLLAAAPLVGHVLAACSQLTALVTSRAPLRLRLEQVMEVPPLAVPAPSPPGPTGVTAHYPSVELFVQRARAVKADFEETQANAAAIAEICRRVDGLPLAIELAAARIKLLPPPDLLERLEHPLGVLTGGARDLPERQQTMRNTIAWSYHLLEAAEQVFFRRLVVFAGGWSMEAAEAVCLPDRRPSVDVLDSLASLVDQGLVTVSEQEEGVARFGMLETIRDYAWELLEGSGEELELRRRHAEYYLTLVEEAEPELTGPDQMAWLSQLERESDNLRQALDWLLQRVDKTPALRLAGALWQFWTIRGHLSEAASWYERALRDDGASAAARAKALYGAGVTAFHRGEQAQATALLAESLQLFRKLEDHRGLAQVLTELAYIANDRGDYDRSVSLYTEALELFRNLGERVHIARTLNDLACARLNQGAIDLARELYIQGLSLSRELGDTRATGVALLNLGAQAAREGKYEQAIDHYTESLELRRALGDESGIALILVNLGEATWLNGDGDRATSLLSESLLLSQRLGNNRITLFCLVTLAGIAAGQSRAERAARLWGASQALGEAMGIAVPPAVLAQYQEHLTDAQRKLGEDAWMAASRQGSDMTLAQAVRYALDEDSVAP